MVLQISPLTVNDCQTLVELGFDAYADDPGAASLFQFPPSEALKASHAEWLRSKWATDPHETWIGVKDSETGEIVAAARWTYEPPQEEGEDEAWKELPTGTEAEAPESNREFSEVMRRKYWEARVDAMGARPFLYLGNLSTFRRHRRRGAATLLLQELLRRSEQLNLPIFLTSSPAAHALYLRHGFTDTRQIEFDVSKVSPTEPVRKAWGMIRPAPNP